MLRLPLGAVLSRTTKAQSDKILWAAGRASQSSQSGSVHATLPVCAANCPSDCRIVPARASALDWRFTAKTRAIITSRREHLQKNSTFTSDCPSSIDMTKTKRSKGSSKRIAAKRLLSSPHVADAFRVMTDSLSACSGTGMIIWIAHLRTARRLH